ncbi:matrix-remodeling-associated protein 7 isoform X1 [Bufo gargarizans]|uniref:matrix-remodeling-associated protein 7 isoform X1 n=1 Tax=Bufo gargarizans TaxID=30331 RepID=UPI001CF2FD73|nr:matrix-remodeling-associated protein 7 isoform X1 [Bufo gargarizans]
MEQAGDFSMTIPLIFTALAVILATLIVKLRASREKEPAEAAAREEKTETAAEEPCEMGEKEDPVAEDEAGERTESDGTIPVEEVGAVEESPQAKENEMEVEECAAKETTPSSHSSQEEEEEDSKEEDFETESDKVLKISEADDADDETFTFKYFPGKLRGSDYEKMLTQEELEEEQRVQREQLGAIFEMMESNRETFGMMSDGDLKEQLKLYNM